MKLPKLLSSSELFFRAMSAQEKAESCPSGRTYRRSLVMQRGLSPSLSQERVICLAFAVQSPVLVDLSSHCSN
ncbi:hypothetical protein F7725_017276 [Dissostichus mawsoni]|uniref:Uncharacterized protein n=1 Tax=Dissostichus mawsoni TaxID=36200 RepID=A0A7J5Z4X0_DISMA|nr:hypothetical protein F7725_017276 [Dissostichus mawsoni]